VVISQNNDLITRAQNKGHLISLQSQSQRIKYPLLFIAVIGAKENIKRSS
jgi:hypothetical protein